MIPSTDLKTTKFNRPLLLALTLLAFGRVSWRLDLQNMWWDESLSLQRAEANWATLLRGTLTMYDGFSLVHTTDQHPFFSFLLQGILIRLAGTSEFVLRYPAAMATTLLVPVVWVLARYFVRRFVLPRTTALWAAGFAALHPFFLWFGQEARPYALWAVLSLLALYLLFRATTPAQSNGTQSNNAKVLPVTTSLTLQKGWFVGYVLITFLSLATHYYAIFWLPLHAIYLYGWTLRKNRWLGPTIVMALMILAGVIGGVVAWQIFSQGGGGNFPEISLAILIPDLVNAFSLGLSVTLDDMVHWLGWIFGGLALVGAVWSLRSRQTVVAGGWMMPLALAIPIALIWLISLLHPAYMNARHLSLLGGAMIVLVGGGLAVLWQWQRLLTGLLALLLVAGLGYSTGQYYTEVRFGKDDYNSMGEHLREHLLPNDVLLISPAFSWRIFDYYLPLDAIAAAQARGVHIAYYGAPLLNVEWPENERLFGELQQEYRRIWLARSGTHPYMDPTGQVPNWLRENNTMRLREVKFFSPTSFLDLELFLTQPPVFEGMDPPAQQRSDVLYGDLIRLVGYDIESPFQPGSALPITLYWQVEETPTVRHKYILQLLLMDEAVSASDTVDNVPLDNATVVAQTEIEPYYGQIPTIFWDPGKTIIEYTSLPPVMLDPQLADRYRLTLQLYTAESLETLPITASVDAPIAADGQRVVLPFVLP